MITKIQNVTQKHHKIIFGILLVLIIIAFVFTIGSSIPYFGDRGGLMDYQPNTFYGYDLKNPEQMREVQVQAMSEAMLSGAETNEAIENLMYRYMYFTHLGNTMNIKTVSSPDLNNYIKSRAYFMSADGKFDESKWNKFVSERTADGRITKDDLNKVLAKNALVEKIENLMAGPGYVLPEEVSGHFKRNYGTWDIQLVKIPFDSFTTKISSDENALKTFYESNKENFRLPMAVGIDVALVPASNFKIDEPSESDLQKFYNDTKSNYATVKDGKTEIPSLATIKDKVIADYKKNSAIKKAMIEAEAIVTKLYDSEAKFTTDLFKNSMAEYGNKVKINNVKNYRPTDSTFPEGIPQSVLAVGYKLDETNFYGDPVPSEEGAWIVFFREKEDSYIPDFNKAKKAVEAVYKNVEKEKAFSEYGKKTKDSIKDGLSKGKQFNELIEMDKVELLSANNFSIMKPTPEMQSVLEAYYLLRDTLPNMKKGDVSDMLTYNKNGYIIYVSKINEPELDANSPIYKNLTKRIQEDYKRASSASSVVK